MRTQLETVTRISRPTLVRPESAPPESSHRSPGIVPDVFATRSARNGVRLDVPQKALVGQRETLFGWGKDNKEKLIDDTADLRAHAADARKYQAELSQMSPSDPKYAQVKQALADASSALSKYGYSADTVPAPGTLWIDPEFLGKSLPNDQVTASQFPVGTPVTKPPTPEAALFGNGKTYRLTDVNGQELAPSPSTLTSYERTVANYRAANGMPRADGRPIGVQMNFEGGGGKGKRYGSALEEMARLGVVPTSVAGTSAGSIAAAIVAAGADPVEIQRFVTDPALGKLLDIHFPSGGLASGQAAFDLFDQELRKLTGITDRPVTFADLKMPLQIVATKMSDSDPATGTGDLTQAKNRTFVFSQETTPNTPVALAVRASMAIPGVFDPVQMVDPMTGREVKLVDGGVLDNLPMRESPDYHLPVVGVGLMERDSLNPDAKRDEPGKLRGGNLDVGNVFKNAYYGAEMAKTAASGTDDYRNMVDPKAGQFMLGIPTWDLTDPSQGDSTLKFGYDPKVDAILDEQTRAVTQRFFSSVLDQLTDPTAKGSNVPGSLPKDFTFDVPVHVKGADYVAHYTGGDNVTFTGKDGSSFTSGLGRDKIEAIYADHVAYGDLAAQLAFAVDHPWQDGIFSKLPF